MYRYLLYKENYGYSLLRYRKFMICDCFFILKEIIYLKKLKE